MIDGGNLLQVNGTVIAGILILLTISSFKESYYFQKGKFFGISPRFAVAMVILPFAFSSICIISPLFDSTFAEKDLLFIAGISSMGGFIYLILAVIFVKFGEGAET